MKRIKIVYFDDKMLKKLIKCKRENLKRIFVNFIKFEFRLKLKNCEIKKNLFWMKNRIYVFYNEKFYKTIFKIIHESFVSDYVEKIIIYDKVFRYYYWFHIIKTITRYIKICFHYKKIKIYRKKKTKLV